MKEEFLRSNASQKSEQNNNRKMSKNHPIRLEKYDEPISNIASSSCDWRISREARQRLARRHLEFKTYYTSNKLQNISLFLVFFFFLQLAHDDPRVPIRYQSN